MLEDRFVYDGLVDYLEFFHQTVPEVFFLTIHPAISPVHITDTPENAPSVSTIPLALEIFHIKYKMGQNKGRVFGSKDIKKNLR